MRTFLLMAVVLGCAGCATMTPQQRFAQGAENCNSICKNNPEINEYSTKAGGFSIAGEPGIALSRCVLLEKGGRSLL